MNYPSLKALGFLLHWRILAQNILRYLYSGISLHKTLRSLFRRDNIIIAHSHHQAKAFVFSRALCLKISASHSYNGLVDFPCIQPHRHIHFPILRYRVYFLAVLIRKLCYVVITGLLFRICQPHQDCSGLCIFVKHNFSKVIHSRNINAYCREFRDN